MALTRENPDRQVGSTWMSQPRMKPSGNRMRRAPCEEASSANMSPRPLPSLPNSCHQRADRYLVLLSRAARVARAHSARPGRFRGGGISANTSTKSKARWRGSLHCRGTPIIWKAVAARRGAPDASGAGDELTQLDGDGREQFRMSLQTKDVIASQANHSDDPLLSAR